MTDFLYTVFGQRPCRLFEADVNDTTFIYFSCREFKSVLCWAAQIVDSQFENENLLLKNAGFFHYFGNSSEIWAKKSKKSLVSEYILIETACVTL